ncbi:hypothetical protein [Nonomuraea sp. JJY05]|jgi:hypothetical protein|uniref:hypothetical protein n=1 Tax=Nonomuraea sp. JJY05 TaxID=3350255 RepID=UPI00373E6DA5
MMDELPAGIAGRFARIEPRRRAAAFVAGLLAEHAGDLTPALEAGQISHVMAVASNHRIPTAAGTRRADEIAARLPKTAGRRLPAGAAAKGQRYYDWALITIANSRAGPPLGADPPPPPHR